MTGTLCDTQIKDHCAKKLLIEENFNPSNVKQCCYELRASSVYHDLTDTSKAERIEVDTSSTSPYILIKPRQNVVIISEETLHMPNDVVGRILSKGQLFSIGLLPVNTYADPGFIGKIGIVLHNSTNNYIKIPPGQAIAKIEFCKLESKVEKPYHGQHGYEMEIWPLPKQLILSKEEIKNDPRILDPYSEIKQAHGPIFSKIVHDLHKIKSKTIFSSIVYLILISLLVFTSFGADGISFTTAIITGILANIVFGLLSYLITNIKPKL